MAKIKGIQVILMNEVDTGKKDRFNRPIKITKEIAVDNVLVAPSSTNEVVNALNLSGKKAVYTIAIPKEDTHVWIDQKVKFFGAIWHVFSFPQQGIEEMIPLDWNAKYMVERYG